MIEVDCTEKYDSMNTHQIRLKMNFKRENKRSLSDVITLKSSSPYIITLSMDNMTVQYSTVLCITCEHSVYPHPRGDNRVGGKPFRTPQGCLKGP